MKLRKTCDWGIKILEQPGKPLLTRFVRKFPIVQGCPRADECQICENDGIRCSPKSVVYRGTCKQCKVDSFSTDGCGGSNILPVYIGETSRPWRERIKEHMSNAENLKSNSVIVHHWAERHGLQTTCPEFEFEIISQYKDPLRRQICEAIHIADQGTLNRKSEFNVNELCRLESNRHWRDLEKEVSQEVESKNVFNSKIKNFIDVMHKVRDYINSETDSNITSRLKRHHSERVEAKVSKRAKIMDCSTPTSFTAYRAKIEIPDETSPIGVYNNQDLTQEEESVSVEKLNRSPTNASNEFAASRITPLKLESSSLEEKKLLTTTNNWSRAAVHCGIIKKTRSLPDLHVSLRSNTFARFQKYSTVVMGKENVIKRSLSLDIFKKEVGGSFDAYASVWSNDTDFGGDGSNDKEGVVVEVVTRKISAIQLGAGVDPKVLEEPATPLGPAGKRMLKVSPDTPVGFARKYRFSESASPNLRDGLNQSVVLDHQDEHKVVRRLIIPKMSTSSVPVVHESAKMRALSTEMSSGGGYFHEGIKVMALSTEKSSETSTYDGILTREGPKRLRKVSTSTTEGRGNVSGNLLTVDSERQRAFSSSDSSVKGGLTASTAKMRSFSVPRDSPRLKRGPKKVVVDKKQPLICDVIKYGVKEENISTKSVVDDEKKSRNEKQEQ